MSTIPNDPFENPQNDQAFAQSPAPRKGGKGCLFGCLIVGVVGLLVCCGGGLVVTYMGIGFLGTEFERQLADNPDIVEHVGEIESFEFSFTGTIEEAQRAEGQGGESALAFDLEGSQGSARLLVVQDNSGGTGIKSATLIMPDGTRHEIDVSNLGGDEDLDMELDEMFDSGDIQLNDSAAGDANTPTITVP